MKKMTCRKLCWSICGRFEQIERQADRENVFDGHRTYFSLAMLVVANEATPTEKARRGLEALHNALAAVLARQNLDRDVSKAVANVG